MKTLRVWKAMTIISIPLLQAMVCTITLVPLAAHAEMLDSGTGTIYRLTADSSYQEGCFPPCMCPIMMHQGLIGTFKLTYSGRIDGIDVYSVDDINWLLEKDGTQIPITGSGTYSIGSPNLITVMQQRMELDLTFDKEPLEHFDSGWVVAGDMSRINIAVSVNNMFCWDKAVFIDALQDSRQCGGIAGFPCTGREEFCKLPEGHCCCDFFGVCTPMPDVCPDVWMPVCGCDGITYGNECEADAAGVSIDYRGACDAICKPDFTCDGDVDGADAAAFKADFGRGSLQRPCTNQDTCNGDFSCDGDVDGSDASLFKQDFGRGPFQNPCPACVTGGHWCGYS